MFSLIEQDVELRKFYTHQEQKSCIDNFLQGARLQHQLTEITYLVLVTVNQKLA